MKRLTVGLLAHVDAGKTTLAESILFLCGAIRKIGRVDHGNTFLDTNVQERNRGITVFSKLAVAETGAMRLTLLDTPGHCDFSAEMERVLPVLDAAVLVISGIDGVQSHTETVWRLLAAYGIPVFLFVNKTDLPAFSRAKVLAELKEKLSPFIEPFDDEEEYPFPERIAQTDERLTDVYLNTGEVPASLVSRSVRERSLFPCLFGSALHSEGVSSLLSCLETYLEEPRYPSVFSARVFKIGRDPSGTRLTYLKLTGGSLRVKQTVEGVHGGKIEGIRFYSGEKYRSADSAAAGDICAVTGLEKTEPGDGLGDAPDVWNPTLQPVLSYRIVTESDLDPFTVCGRLRVFSEEDPALHLRWSEDRKEMELSLMGEIQMEILSGEILRRTGIRVRFDEPRVVYRETVSRPVSCAGHFEPLRHYAEVHLLLEPGIPGEGVVFDTVCPERVLAGSWQRLILSQLEEAMPSGVLTGGELTDLHVVLTGGRAHPKHTEGGDFLQAARRAVRQGLMKARSEGSAVLLEPWYRYTLSVPVSCSGRALHDLERRSATVTLRTSDSGLEAVITGCIPVSEAREYGAEVRGYTGGRGKLTLVPHGYAPCHNPEGAISASGYDPEKDPDCPSASVFCRSGAGFLVPWEEADRAMHAESVLSPRDGKEETDVPLRSGPAEGPSRSAREWSERELREIFERTYGPVRSRTFFSPSPPGKTAETRETYLSHTDPAEEYVLVDGYNIIHAWEELASVARDSMDLAREMLIRMMVNYQGFTGCNLILVFDAYRTDIPRGRIERNGGIFLIFTGTKETADAFIERVTYDIGKNREVRVATSDSLEQMIILGHGARRVSARAFGEEVRGVLDQMARLLDTGREQ